MNRQREVNGKKVIVLHDEFAEQQLWAAAVMAPEQIPVLMEMVTPQDFFVKANGDAFGVACRMYAGGQQIGPATFGNRLPRELLDALGGPSGAGSTLDECGEPYNAPAYAQQVADWSKVRRAYEVLRWAGREINNLDYEGVGGFISELNTRWSEVLHSARARSEVSAAEALEDFLAELDRRREGVQQGHGVRTGFTRMDDALISFEPGSVIVLHAPTGEGKTQLATAIAANNAEAGRASYIFGMEMPPRQYMERLVSFRAQISGVSLRRGTLSEGEWHRLEAQQEGIRSLPLWFCEEVLDLPTLERFVHGARARHGIELFVLDYLQLVHHEVRGESRHLAVEEVARRMKNLAMRLGTVFLLVAQENEEGRTRESKGIEQACDVRLRWRRERDADGNEFYSCEVKKSRSVPVSPDVRLYFDWDRSTGRFEEIDPETRAPVARQASSEMEVQNVVDPYLGAGEGDAGATVRDGTEG